jgi:uncharacterized protein YbjT (DUF2867 family)
MILVTGAAGKTGRAVINALVSSGATVRALVHRLDQTPTVEKLGVQDIIVGDMRSRDILERAAAGVRAVYHIPPNVSPDEVLIGQVVIAAAQSTGIEHIVYHSVLHPQTERMPHHWCKLRVEEQVIESGIPFTILQPATYMQNILAHKDQIVEQGIFPVPYSVETRLSLVDLEDVAQVAALVLTESGHEGATYELVGVKAISQADLAETLSHALNREVRAKFTPRESWAEQARLAGLGDYQIETLVKMFVYYERYGFPGNPRILGWLLSREPTNFTVFAERMVKLKEII